MDYVRNSLEMLFNNIEYLMRVALVVLVITLAVVLAVKVMMNVRKRTRRAIPANLVLALVIFAFVLAVELTQGDRRWHLIVAFLPSILVGYQAFFLWSSQPKEVKREGDQDREKEWESSLLKESRKIALSVVSGHFGVRTLLIRYVFPAVLLGIAGVVILQVLVDPGPFSR